MWTDHGDLLPDYRPLLDKDVEALGESAAANLEYWVELTKTGYQERCATCI